MDSVYCASPIRLVHIHDRVVASGHMHHVVVLQSNNTALNRHHCFI
jgi:hypothetical protein